MKSISFGVFVVAGIVSGCGGAPAAPSSTDLLATPTSVAFGGKTLTVTVYPNRDFMPGSGDGLLTLAIELKTGDGTVVPESVSIDAVWAVDGAETFSAWSLEPLSRSAFPPDLVVNARRGPVWPIGSLVTAVVRLIDGIGNTTRLRAPSEPIYESS